MNTFLLHEAGGISRKIGDRKHSIVWIEIMYSIEGTISSVNICKANKDSDDAKKIPLWESTTDTLIEELQRLKAEHNYRQSLRDS